MRHLGIQQPSKTVFPNGEKTFLFLFTPTLSFQPSCRPECEKWEGVALADETTSVSDPDPHKIQLLGPDPDPWTLIFTQIYEFQPVFSKKKSCDFPLYYTKIINVYIVIVSITKTLLQRGLDPNPHSTGTLDPDPFRIEILGSIRIHIKRMRIRNTGKNSKREEIQVILFFNGSKTRSMV